MRQPDQAAIPLLVAHRGDPANFPENSLPGIVAALEAGAGLIEFDVQMTRDGVPVVLHDPSLERTAGVDMCIADLTLRELEGIDANEAQRFGPKFHDIHVPTLAQLVSLLRDWPHVRAFVEIKRASLELFGTAAVVEKVIDVLQPVQQRCILISFSGQAVEHARRLGAVAIGWIIDTWNEDSRRQARALQPGYLICNHEKIPPDLARLWTGSWQWMVYDVTVPDLALRLGERGADFAETMAIADMLQQPPFREQALGRY